MDLQTLSDRAEIIDLISAYNKASFYCDVKGYADTFTHDGRYINANHGWVVWVPEILAPQFRKLWPGDLMP
jgi:hypothetical protein